MNRNRKWLVLGGCLGIAAGLWALARPAPSPPSAPAQPPPAVTLHEVMRRAHFAFQPDGDGWQGGHSTYSARVEKGATELAALPASGDRTALRLGATTVERGGRSLSGGEPSAERQPTGALAVRRGEIVERLVNQERGLEQSWEVAALPDGAGALRFRVPVDGRFVGASDTGLHFSVGALGFAYGHATWIDGRGVRTKVPSRWDGAAVVMEVPEEVLVASAFPAVLDPLVSPELGMDDPVLTSAPGDQAQPALAWNGTHYLAVWSDRRDGSGISQVFGARLLPGGSVVDPAGFLIGAPGSGQSEPAVTSAGSGFAVVWADYRSGSRTAVFGARVATDGTVLDPGGKALSSDTSLNCGNPSIAWSGTGYLVVWDQNDDDGIDPATYSTVFGRRFDGALVPVGVPFAISSTTGTGFQRFADVAWDDTNFLVVWQDLRTTDDIYGARVSSLGAVLDTPPFAISTAAGEQSRPKLAWNGLTHLVVWGDLRSGGSDIYGAHVSPTKVVAQGSATGLAISTATNNQTGPDVAAFGTDKFLVAWADARGASTDIYAARVSNGGVVSETAAAGLAVSTSAGSQQLPAVASDGTNALVAWQDSRTAFADIYAGRVSGTGTLLDGTGVLLSKAGNVQRAPAIAFDGTNYLVVWEDVRDGVNSDIYGTRVARDGGALDTAGLAISTASGHQKNPAVAWNGSHYLVAWQDERTSASAPDIYAARVSPQGTVTDGTGLLISGAANSQQTPAVASNGDESLVVWDDRRDGGANIFGARVYRDGGVQPPLGFEINAGAFAQTFPALAWNGGTYLVVWQSSPAAGSDIYGTPVSSAGVVSSPSGQALCTAPSNQLWPAVAASGTTFLVAWADARDYADSGTDIWAARVTQGGTSLDFNGRRYTDGRYDQQHPAIASDGTNFQLVWEDHRLGSFAPDISGTRISPASGAPLDAPTLLIAGSSLPESTPALASSGPRSFLVAYQGFDPSPGASTSRIRGRTLSNARPSAAPASVTTAEDTAVVVPLDGGDADGDPLTFTVVTQPQHGALSGGLSLSYVPTVDYNGPDSFSFTTSDGIEVSAPATVSLTVTPVNDLPVADGGAFSTQEDTAVALTLGGSDVDGDALAYTVVSAPSSGVLSGTAPNLTYAPAANFSGTDTFTFKVNDGTGDSLTSATVTVTVAAVNDAPVATAQTVSTAEEAPLAITLSGTDVEGDALSFAVVTPPPNGSLTGTPPLLTYTPNADFTGSDVFSFKAGDGKADSAPVSISVIVTPVNDAPVAQDQSLATAHDTPLNFTLFGADVDGDPLEYVIVAQPAQGSLSGTGPSRTYTPNAGFTGTDELTYQVKDAALSSAIAKVTITVGAPGETPIPQTPSTPKTDTAQLNGWSCGCSQASGGAALWGGLALLAAALRRRSRRGAEGSTARGALASAAPPHRSLRGAQGSTARGALLLALLIGGHARAAEPKKPPQGLPTLAAPDVVVTVADEKLDAAAFSDVMVAAVGETGLFRVISAAEVSALIGLERQKQLLGCSEEESCLTELSGALGASFLMQGSIGKVAQNYVVTVRLLDVREARALGRSVLQTQDRNLLLSLVWRATQEALDAAATGLPPAEAKRWKDRPRSEPPASVSGERSRFGVMLSGVGSYQPLAEVGSRGTVGGEAAVTWRTGRLDVGAGVVISPTPGGRLFASFALLNGRNRLALGLRGTAFPTAGVFGGGPAAFYELALTDLVGLHATLAAEAYGGGPSLVLALLGGVGVAAHF